MRRYKSKNAIANRLDAAADLLEKSGVTKGRYSKKKPDGTYAYCSVGAIREVTKGYYNDDIEDALEAHVREKFNLASCQDVPQWNDHKSRKPATIIKAFRDAAKRVRAGEIEVE